ITFAGNQDAANQTVGAITAAGRKGYAIQADSADPVAQRAAIKEAIEKLGGLDILVHNAGIADFASIETDPADSFRRQFGVNVDGVFAGTA
ncbi:SDR family NAD(P)-dependent oxidoreductase, partial [Acinetobacter baumannii]